MKKPYLGKLNFELSYFSVSLLPIKSNHMRDIIIPVDFSETSLNAARYGAAMLTGKPNTRVVLYTMFKDEEDAATSEQYLQSLKAEMEQKGVLSD